MGESTFNEDGSFIFNGSVYELKQQTAATGRREEASSNGLKDLCIEATDREHLEVGIPSKNG